MALQGNRAPVFDRPGGDRSMTASNRPIDMAHLARQTLGDRALEAEVLGLFLHQIGSIYDRVAACDAEERRMLAHGLVGSARGIGAFSLAECAADMEARPGSEILHKRLRVKIDEVRDFIAAISR